MTAGRYEEGELLRPVGRTRASRPARRRGPQTGSDPGVAADPAPAADQPVSPDQLLGLLGALGALQQTVEALAARNAELEQRVEALSILLEDALPVPAPPRKAARRRTAAHPAD